jgi:hypothetical protein
VQLVKRDVLNFIVNSFVAIYGGRYKHNHNSVSQKKVTRRSSGCPSTPYEGV